MLGDFDYNIHQKKGSISNNYLIDYLTTFNLETALPHDAITTNLSTQINVIFTNCTNINCGVYETYFSYHKPIFAVIKDPNTTVEKSKLSNYNENHCKTNKKETSKLFDFKNEKNKKNDII